MKPSGGGTRVEHLSPPDNFGVVEDGVYRSAYPQSKAHVAFLKERGLRTLLLLGIDALPRQTREGLEANGVTVTWLGSLAWADRDEMAETLLWEALKRVTDADNHPMLLACRTGELQTSAVVGCLRRLQDWPLSSVMDEYDRYATTPVSEHRCAVTYAIETFPVSRFVTATIDPRLLAQKNAMREYETAASPPRHNRGPSEDRVVEVSPTVKPQPVTGFSTPNLAQPVPLWYIRHVAHRIALQDVAERRSSAPGQQQQRLGSHVPEGLAHMRRGLRSAAYEQYRLVANAPLISDPSGYDPAESLADEDDD